MKRLIYILMLLPFVAYGQKKDFLRTPNSNNIIVDWNLKSYTFNAPHGLAPSLRGAPDSTGYIFVQDSLGVQQLRYYSGGIWRRLKPELAGLTDSLAKKSNRDYSNVANGAIPQAKMVGLSDSLNKKVNRTFDNVATNGIPQIKVSRLSDSLANKTNRNFDNVALGAIPINRLAASTISGVALGGTLQALGLNSTLMYTSGSGYTGATARTMGINLANPNTWTGVQTFSVAPVVPTGTALAGGMNAASQAYADNAVANAGRGRVVLSGNVTAILNYDYLNNTGTQYTITPPTTTGFANDGSKIITGLSTGSGGIRVSCPSGYTIQTPSGNVTPGTGFATIGQNQKFQLIPVGSNAYYLQPLNGSITVS